MKAVIERWLHRRWYGDIVPGLGLRALAGAYRVLSARRSGSAPGRPLVPVIVVGNFTAGGTGKTPLVIALARHFSARGFTPGIVSRGHGRRTAAPVQVGPDTPVEICGDEPFLMREKTGVPVLVDSDRVAAARAAVDAGCDLVIADDGLQHRRLARDLEIEVVDGERRYGNGLLLPAGPLREMPRPCDFRVINGRDAVDGDWLMQLVPGDAVNVSYRTRRRALSEFSSGAAVHAVAGIGNPARFFNSLRDLGLGVIEHPFADHHQFRAEDFSGMTGPILMTEKDAVKCRRIGLQDAWSVPVEARLPVGFLAAVEDRLKEKHA